MTEQHERQHALLAERREAWVAAGRPKTHGKGRTAAKAHVARTYGLSLDGHLSGLHGRNDLRSRPGAVKTFDELHAAHEELHR